MKKVKSKKLNSNGMTLIEVLVSASILAVVLVSLTKLYYLTSYNINTSRHKTMAVNLAQTSVENIISTGYDFIVTGDYPLTQGVVIDPRKLDELTDDLNGIMTTALSNLNTNEGYKFIVTVAWNEPFGGSSRALTEVVETLLTNYK